MNCRSLAFCAVVLISSLALGQGQPVEKRKVGDSASLPVSQTECSTTFAKLEKVLFRLAGVNESLPKLPSGDAPAKRADIVARLDRIFEVCKPKFKFMPRRVNFDAKSLALPVGHPQRQALEKLVKWGCVGKVTPLAVAKSETVSALDFGDAVGLFILRIADVTHRPDPKFSPIISGG